MSRHLFYSEVLLFLLFVMMCRGSGATATDKPNSCQGSSPGKYFDWRDTKGDETVSLLRVPSFVELNGDVFVVAEAQCTTKGCGFTGISSVLLELKGGTLKEELDESKLKTQVLDECSSEAGQCSSQIGVLADSQRVKNVHVGRPTTVVKGFDVYMVAGNYGWKASADAGESGADELGLLLVRGNVSAEGGTRRIHWRDNYRLPWTSNGRQHESLRRLIGGGGSGIKMKDGTFLFPVEGTKKEKDDAEKDGKTVSLIIYTSKEVTNWKLSKEMSDGGCSDPSVVEWEKDKLIMMTACDDGRRRVYESGDKGDLWTEALGTLSRVWGNKNGGRGVRSGFITAKIEDRDVMLVTLPVYAKEKDKENEKGELHLWLTDNTHIAYIGPISGEREDVAASSLLYESGKDNNNEEKLIALYEKKKGDADTASLGMVSVLLTEQLKRVKDVLATWKKVDEIVSQLCTNSIAEEDRSPGAACTAVKITDGLVGFLSSNFSDKTWRDEYLGVNATVKGNDGGAAAATVDSEKGVKFQGVWAEWPVGEQGENQLYHFANYNFTLVATVSIDGVPTQDGTIPLMGMKMNDAENTVLLGLSYNSGGKWKLSCGGEAFKELSSTWEPEETHQLAIVLQNGTHGSAYVDGQRVGEAPCALENNDSKGISHLYIGGDGGSADNKRGQEVVSVTVTNVLLYNRPLSSADITAFNTKLSISKQKDPQAVTGDARAPEVREPPAPVTVPQTSLGVQEQGEQELLKTSKVADSHAVSTSTVLTATTSSGEEGSVNQSASGTSSEGTQSVHGASSSDFNPTVGTGAGGKTQEDEPHKTPAGNVNAADANAPTTMGEGREGPAVNLEASARSGGNGETAGGKNGQEEKQIHPHDGEANATALSSSLGNASQGNNNDAGTMRESGMVLPLLLLLGLWGFAAL
ncbi:putative trans-sialidase [Trypanosoma cruzi]|nr:putative trans-sialidase [Trypanosoma cruzi]